MVFEPPVVVLGHVVHAPLLHAGQIPSLKNFGFDVHTLYFILGGSHEDDLHIKFDPHTSSQLVHLLFTPVTEQVLESDKQLFTPQFPSDTLLQSGSTFWQHVSPKKFFSPAQARSSQSFFSLQSLSKPSLHIVSVSVFVMS